MGKASKDSIILWLRSNLNMKSMGLGCDALSVWRIFCLCAVLLLLGLMVWSSAMYRRIERNEFISQAVKDQKSAPLDEQRLQDILRVIDERKIEFNKIISNKQLRAF